MKNVDIALDRNPDTGLFDISFDENGDFKLVDSLDTSLKLSLFTDQRADKSEVQAAERRRGHWGDNFPDPPGS